MARDLRLDIIADSASARRGLDQTARSVDNLADQTKQLERSFISASGAAVVTGKQIDNIGDQARQSARAVDNLGDQLAQMGRKGAAARLAPGGGGTGGLLGGLAKDGAKAGAETASTFASAFQGGVLETVGKLPPEAKAAIAAGVGAAVAAAGPFIASAIAGSVLLGIGAAGIGAGIALAVQDPAVKAAFGELGTGILSGLTKAAEPFKAALLGTTKIFGDSFLRIQPAFVRIFEALSKAVQPLARGLAGLVERAMPGLEKAAKAAGPFIESLAKELPNVGRALSSFFDSMAESGPGAADAFKVILISVEALIETLGELIEWGSRVFHSLAVLTDISGIFHDTAAEGQVLGGTFEDLGTSAYGAKRAVLELKFALEKLLDNQLDAREATIAYEQAVDDLVKGFKRGKDALDVNEQKGRDNIRLVDDTIRKLQEKRDADIKAAGGTEEATARANAAYQAQIDRLREVLRRLGLNNDQINTLLGLAGQIPHDITIDVSLFGAQRAIGLLGGLSAAIGRVANSSSGGGLVGAAVAAAAHRAAGGPVQAGRAYIVGERQPELFVPSVSGRILPSTPSTSATLNVTGDPNSWLYKVIMEGVRTGQLQISTR